LHVIRGVKLTVLTEKKEEKRVRSFRPDASNRTESIAPQEETTTKGRRREERIGGFNFLSREWGKAANGKLSRSSLGNGQGK